MYSLSQHGKKLLQALLAFLRWALFALLIGVAVGGVGAAFYHGISLATRLRGEHPWLVFLLPVAGAAIALGYRLSGMEQDQGTNLILLAVRDAQPVRLRVAPLIFLSTILTHLFGGSAGREGAALQLGGSLGAQAGRLLHVDETDERTMVTCGMAAGFSALFGTPITAALFAMEVVSVGKLYHASLVPGILSALTAQVTAQALGAAPGGYELLGCVAVSPLSLLQVTVLGGLCAVLSVVFCMAVHAAPHLYERVTQDRVARAVLGGCLVVVLTVLVGSQDYNGAGGAVIQQAVAGQARPEAFLMKILFTAVTLGAGFRGGEIVPLLFTGAAFGCTAGPLLGLEASFGAALSMTAVFCGATNCPISSILLSFELFGGEGLPLFTLCCAVSFALSGYYSLYTEQRIVYAKLRNEKINQKTK